MWYLYTYIFMYFYANRGRDRVGASNLGYLDNLTLFGKCLGNDISVASQRFTPLFSLITDK